MDECRPILNTGLRGFKVATSRISDVNGDIGKIVYRGYLVQDLAENASFEEVVYLLLFEKLPSQEELAGFKERLAVESRIPAALVAALKTRPADALPMDILQAGVAMLAHHDPDVRQHTPEATTRMGLRLIARIPAILAAWDRIRNGQEPLDPAAGLGHAASFLYMLQGREPEAEVARFMDVALTLHAEHTFNASTFAAREVASTRAHMYAAVAAAVGSLSGELHGGANVRVMQMLQKIGSIDAVAAYVHQELEAGRLIFGLGHAVYKVDDPRAMILAPMARTMGQRVGQPQWYEISRALERSGKEIFKKKKGIDIFTNVDFFSASLYYTMGIPLDFFTPVFAIARIAGWVAHVIEEQFAGAAEKPVLYRPESQYVGDYCGPDTCEYVALDKR
ncbi:MAG: citrate/2-methylcitrate synthase [Desulfobacterales bacterium]|nr:citrate/2-methylcitrate synthase [Desulfobacterales bacterium]